MPKHLPLPLSMSLSMRRRVALPLLALTLLAAACNRTPTPTDTAAPTTGDATPAANATTPSAQPPDAPRFDARLAIANNNGQVRYDGVVDTAATRDRIQQALVAAYGPGRVSGTLSVDPAARAPEWLDNLAPFLRALSMPGAALELEGRRVALSGAVDRRDRTALLEAARGLFPGFSYAGLLHGLDPADATRDPATQAVASLRPGAPMGEVIATLNRAPLRFESESAALDAGSLDLVSRTADALKSAPKGTRIEIAGPIVDTGDAEGDLALSQQRAQALKAQLIVQGVDPGAIETRGRTAAEADIAVTPGSVRFRVVR